MAFFTTGSPIYFADFDLNLRFDTPEIGVLALPLIVFIAAVSIWVHLKRGRSSGGGGRRAMIVTLGVVAAGVGIYLSRSANPGTRRALLLAALGVVVFLAAPSSYSKTTTAVRPFARRTLIFLRLLVIVAVLSLISRPIVERTIVRMERPTLTILLDDSQSMKIRDMPGPVSDRPVSRASALHTALTVNWYRLGQLADSFDISAFRFSDIPSRESAMKTRPWSVEGEGPLTDIEAALAVAVREDGVGELPPGAILILSDGANNVKTDSDALTMARSLAASGVPIFAAGIGSPEPRGDTRLLSGRDLRVPHRAAVDTMLPIEAEFECVGFSGTRIRFQCLWDGKVVGTKTVRPKSLRETIQVSFEHIALSAGFHSVEVRAMPRDLSWKEGPVSLAQYVRVVDDQIHILHIEARLRTEFAFISRALAGEKRFQLTKAILGPPIEGMWRNPLPRRPEEWMRYHAIILGDLTRTDLTESQIKGLRDAVNEHGTGIAMIGGFENTARRGFGETPLAEVVPVELGGGMSIDKAVRLATTPAGVDHPVCRLKEGSDVVDLWRRLPALAGVTVLGRPKPAAEVLIVDEASNPVIVAATVGKGRSLAIGVDSTWRWRMQRNDGRELHNRFWRQALYWLANRRPNVHVAVDRPRYDLLRVRPGTSGVEVAAYVVDGLSGRPLESAKVEVTLTTPDDKSEIVRMQRLGDRWIGRVFPQETGSYRLQLTAKSSDQEFGRSETRFVVEAIDRERRNPLANLDLMKALAAGSGDVKGAYADLGELEQLLEALDAGDFRRRITETVREDLADRFRWPVLAAICLLLTIEWVIRKRCGLV